MNATPELFTSIVGDIARKHLTDIAPADTIGDAECEALQLLGDQATSTAMDALRFRVGAEWNKTIVVSRKEWLEQTLEDFDGYLKAVFEAAVGKNSASGSGRAGGEVSKLANEIMERAHPSGAIGGMGVVFGAMLGDLASVAVQSYDASVPRPMERPLLIVGPNAARFGESSLRWLCWDAAFHHVVFHRPAVRQRLDQLLTSYIAGFQFTEEKLLRVAMAAKAAPVQGDADADALFSVLRTPAQERAAEQMKAILSVVAAHSRFQARCQENTFVRLTDEVAPLLSDELNKRIRFRGFAYWFGLAVNQTQQAHADSFIAAVAAAGELGRLWTSPAGLPSPNDLHDPQLWISRLNKSAS